MSYDRKQVQFDECEAKYFLNYDEVLLLMVILCRIPG